MFQCLGELIAHAARRIPDSCQIDIEFFQIARRHNIRAGGKLAYLFLQRAQPRGYRSGLHFIAPLENAQIFSLHFRQVGVSPLKRRALFHRPISRPDRLHEAAADSRRRAKRRIAYRPIRPSPSRHALRRPLRPSLRLRHALKALFHIAQNAALQAQRVIRGLNAPPQTLILVAALFGAFILRVENPQLARVAVDRVAPRCLQPRQRLQILGEALNRLPRILKPPARAARRYLHAAQTGFCVPQIFLEIRIYAPVQVDQNFPRGHRPLPIARSAACASSRSISSTTARYAIASS